VVIAALYFDILERMCREQPVGNLLVAVVNHLWVKPHDICSITDTAEGRSQRHGDSSPFGDAAPALSQAE